MSHQNIFSSYTRICNVDVYTVLHVHAFTFATVHTVLYFAFGGHFIGKWWLQTGVIMYRWVLSVKVRCKEVRQYLSWNNWWLTIMIMKQSSLRIAINGKIYGFDSPDQRSFIELKTWKMSSKFIFVRCCVGSCLQRLALFLYKKHQKIRQLLSW